MEGVVMIGKTVSHYKILATKAISFRKKLWIVGRNE
jgi:hypothetical protein